MMTMIDDNRDRAGCFRTTLNVLMLSDSSWISTKDCPLEACLLKGLRRQILVWSTIIVIFETNAASKGRGVA